MGRALGPALTGAGSPAGERREHIDTGADLPEVVTADDAVDQKRTGCENPFHSGTITRYEECAQFSHRRRGVDCLLLPARRVSGCGEVAHQHLSHR